MPHVPVASSQRRVAAGATRAITQQTGGRVPLSSHADKGDWVPVHNTPQAGSGMKQTVANMASATGTGTLEVAVCMHVPPAEQQDTLSQACTGRGLPRSYRHSFGTRTALRPPKRARLRNPH